MGNNENNAEKAINTGTEVHSRIAVQKALVSGSYDPFTNAHLEIIQQASEMFDTVYVVIFINSSKKRMFSPSEMLEPIRQTLAEKGINNCIVDSNDGLLARYCIDRGITYNIRGLRDNLDFSYEEKIKAFNARICPRLKTIYLCDSGGKLSSSDVRELLMYNEDISNYVPAPVADMIMRKFQSAKLLPQNKNS